MTLLFSFQFYFYFSNYLTQGTYYTVVAFSISTLNFFHIAYENYPLDSFITFKPSFNFSRHTFLLSLLKRATIHYLYKEHIYAKQAMFSSLNIL